MTGSPLGSHRLPVLSDAELRQHAARLAQRQEPGSVLVLRGEPVGNYPAEFQVDSRTVGVCGCRSALAIRDAMRTRTGEDYLLVITDLREAELGADLVSRVVGNRVQLPDTWVTVARMFGVQQVTSETSELGLVVADALLSAQPAKGYPAAPGTHLTRDLALRSLTEQVLDLPASSLTPAGLMQWSQDLAARRSWRARDEKIRSAITGWVTGEVGEVGAAILDIGASPRELDAASVGLVVDVLWPAPSPAPGSQSAGNTGPGPAAPAAALVARGRLEEYLSGRDLDQHTARALADTARGLLLRMAGAQQRERVVLLERAEALLADLGWPEGADRSTVLPAGFLARLRALAAQLTVTGSDPEPLLADLAAHDAAASDRRREFSTAQMAVRLGRWLAAGRSDRPGSLAAAIGRHMAEDSWADRALADVAAGSNDPIVAAAYRGLSERVLSARREHDVEFGRLLAEATASKADLAGVPLIEDLVSGPVSGLARGNHKVLLVVVDGMSAPVAHELAEGAAELGWQEMLPADGPGRSGVLAVLPTMTTYSRTSLLAGRLLAGNQDTEKQEFARLARGPVFHKNDLRAAAGEALPAKVRQAISGSDRIVAVVLNSVDDALAKHDPDSTSWTISTVQHLRNLLDLAAGTNRTVVLTADHGHVVERGSEYRPYPAAEARWRGVGTGPVNPADEVLLAGPRVLADGGEVIAAAVEQLRYGRKSAGYHGGATPAEAVVPVIVLSRDPAGLGDRWAEAPPQAPAWWYEPVAGQRDRAAPEPAPARRPKPRRPPVRQEEALFAEPAPPAEPTGAGPAGVGSGPSAAAELAGRIVASEIYAQQQRRAGRGALGEDQVRAVLALLIAGSGRADRDAVSAAAGIPAARFQQALAMLRRQLNVEGYDVISLDADQRTVVLDLPLARSQFEVDR